MAELRNYQARVAAAGSRADAAIDEGLEDNEEAFDVVAVKAGGGFVEEE